jgi:hypothetical protein
VSPSEVLFRETITCVPGGHVSRPEQSKKRDSMKASAKQSNDQNDPASAVNSVLPCSDHEQLPVDSELQNQETTSSSLIENWIDA